MRNRTAMSMGMLLAATVMAATAAADTLASYGKYTVKEKSKAIDAVAAKHDVWLEDDQFESMDTCIKGHVAKGPANRDLGDAIQECFMKIVRSDQLF